MDTPPLYYKVYERRHAGTLDVNGPTTEVVGVGSKIV